jgi:hypothetical protein
VLKLDRLSLLKGYEEVVMQELRIDTDHVKFRKDKFCTASTGQTWLAPLPTGYGGEFGPNLKSLLFSHLCNRTEPKIADRLSNLGIVIPAANIGVAHGCVPGTPGGKAGDCCKPDLAAVLGRQHIDDPGTRVDGENQHCQIFCNPLYGAYFTTARKDRLTLIDVLGNIRQRIFRLHEEFLDWLLPLVVSQLMLERIGQLPFPQSWERGRVAAKADGADSGSGSRGSQPDYGGGSGSQSRRERACRLLMCDDAKQFQLVADELALVEVADSPLLTTPNLPKMPPDHCTLLHGGAAVNERCCGKMI